MKVTMRKC